MKATVIAVFAVLLAVAAATEMPKEEVFGECPEFDGPKPTYLMDKWYREVFYECSNGTPIRHICPEGLVFDPRTNVCNFPNLDCKPYGPVGTCPNPDEDRYRVSYLRDGANVSVYYQCYMSVEPMMRRCERDNYFDMIEKKCKVLP